MSISEDYCTGADQLIPDKSYYIIIRPQSSPTHDGSLLKNVREMKSKFTITVPTATTEETAQS